MKYQIKNLLIGAMMVIAFGSCSEQEPDVFQDINGVYLNNRTNTNILQDKTNVTFVYEKGDEMQVPVKIQLVGRPSDQPREIALTVVRRMHRKAWIMFFQRRLSCQQAKQPWSI